MGGYDDTPANMLRDLEFFFADGLVNAVAGCFGTTPDHIAAISERASRFPKRQVPKVDRLMRLSGLEHFNYRPNVGSMRSTFLNVGERCNVAGSRMFINAIKDGNFEKAMTIAIKQVQQGANLLDINMDDGLIDGVSAMTMFINMIKTDPEIAKVPFMIDSSKFHIAIAGVKCC